MALWTGDSEYTSIVIDGDMLASLLLFIYFYLSIFLYMLHKILLEYVGTILKKYFVFENILDLKSSTYF